MSTNNRGQMDDETFRYVSDNAEVEHMLFTPVRWLSGAFKAVIYILLVLGWFIFTLLGWTVNVGEYSVENRREAVCDPRAYILKCDSIELTRFNQDHDVTNYAWDLVHGPDAIPSNGGSPWRMTGDISPASEEQRTPSAWINFGDGDFFQRGNDVFRRKSAQMDYAIGMGALAADALRSHIAESKGVDKDVIRLYDAPVIELRQGKAPANSMSDTHRITYGLCLRQECQPEDLNYALYWGDVLWAKPALGKHQQDAVDALTRLDTVAFWLQEAHANGVQDDVLIESEFRDHQRLIAMIFQDHDPEILREK